MNDELQKALAASIGKVVNAAEAGASFLQVELPEVIRQLLVWKAFEYGALAIIFIGMGAWLLVKSIGWFKKGYEEVEDGLLFVSTIVGVASSTMLLGGIWKAMLIVQILIAPKVYLIEFAASLVSK